MIQISRKHMVGAGIYMGAPEVAARAVAGMASTVIAALPALTAALAVHIMTNIRCNP
jgi:hypothetical protein